MVEYGLDPKLHPDRGSGFSNMLELLHISPVRTWLLCLLILLTHLSPSFGEAAASSSHAPPQEESMTIIDQTTPDGRAEVRAVFRLKAAPNTVYETLRDPSQFPEFMPNSRDVQILESGEDYQVVQIWGTNNLMGRSVTAKRVYHDVELRISWSLVESRLKSGNGYWHVKATPDKKGSIVTYWNSVEAGALVPDTITRIFLRRHIEKAAENIQRRIDSGGIWKSSEYLRRIQDGTKHEFDMLD